MGLILESEALEAHQSKVCDKDLFRVSVRHLEIMQGVGFQYSKELLLPLLKTELRVFWEGAVDIPLYDLFHFFLAYADLTEGFVPTPFRVNSRNGPGDMADSLQ